MSYPPARSIFRKDDGFVPLSSDQDTPLERSTHARGGGSRAYRIRAFLSVGLHCFLILIHVVLLVLCLRHSERSVTFPLTSFTLEWYPYTVATSIQVFVTILLAVVVASAQSLAFRSNLYVRQTLTALHDKSNAWLGLGAACSSLWDQFKLRAAMLNVAYITAYLVGIWLLHVTMPTVLDVVPFNATLSVVNQTTLANRTSPYANFASAYDILAVYDQVPQLGLNGNMVYDIIPQVANANGSTKVNASVYEVDCSALVPSLPMQARPVPRWGNTTITWLGLEVGKEANGATSSFSASLPYGAPAIITAQGMDIEHNCPKDSRIYSEQYNPGTCWTPIVLVSTVNVLDSAGNQAPVPGGPWQPIPAPVVVPAPAEGPAVMITAVQLIACNVNITNYIVDISTDSREPVDPVTRPRTDAIWKMWDWPDDLMLTDQLRIAQNAPWFSPPSAHGSFVSVAAGSLSSVPAAPPVALRGMNLTRFQVDPVDGNVMPNEILRSAHMNAVVPTAFDIFLTEDLSLVSENRTNVTLVEINHSLAKALAATFWHGNNVQYQSAHTVNRLFQPQNAYLLQNTARLNLTVSGMNGTSAYGEATVEVLVQMLRLNLNLFPILGGLVVSVALLALCVVLIRVPRRARAAFDPHLIVDSGGLLQYTWLLGTEPHLAELESPELEDLRAAGMYEVQFDERVSRRQARPPRDIEGSA